MLYKIVILKYNIGMFSELIDNKKIKSNLADPLSLAFLGDAVHSLYVRTILVASKDYKQKDLQKISSSIVCANNQSLALYKIEPLLNDDEIAILKRARNAHNNNKAKNSTASDYKRSTAFEAIIGYLYLNKEFDKIKKFIEITIETATASQE